jgi:hypothetical protein
MNPLSMGQGCLCKAMQALQPLEGKGADRKQKRVTKTLTRFVAQVSRRRKGVSNDRRLSP